MASRRRKTPSRRRRTAPGRVTIKALAEHVGLSPSTVSLVLNRSPVADSIPQETKDRVFVAARELDYRPNYLARSLRSRRTFTIGIVLPEVSEGYAAGIVSGVEARLLQDGYFYLLAGHRRDEERLDECMGLLQDRSVDGLVLINTPISEPPRLPTVAVSGHTELAGVTNVIIDHDRGAITALAHLKELGHERIAFFKGHRRTSDAAVRWAAIARAAHELGLEIRPELTLQLSGDSAGAEFSPEEGYEEGHVFGRRLLDRGEELTALFAFNDISAIGAMRAFLDADLSVPEDVSIIGFDDIESAAYQNPSLTTVRQPLRQMGETAAEVLLAQLAGGAAPGSFVTIEPELVVRDSTGPAPETWRRPRRRAARAC